MSRYFEIVQGGSSSGPVRCELPVRIGGQDADVPIPETERDICWIGETGGHLFLQPLPGATEIFHNNEKVSGSVWIKSGDITRIGSLAVRYVISGDVVTLIVQDTSSFKPGVKPRGGGADGVVMPGDRPDDISRGGHTLPDTANSVSRHSWHLSFRFMAGCAVLAILLLAAIYLAVSQGFEIKIEPVPDLLRVKGRFPAVCVGNRCIALPGTYRVHAEKKGFRPLDEDIILKEGAGLFSFSMKPLPGIVSVTSEPSGARVSVDGMYLGNTPLRDIELDAGMRSIRLELVRYLPEEQQIKVQGRGMKQQFSFVLQAGWADVKVDTIPRGARVFLDGADTGAVTPAVIEVTGGRHEVSFLKEKFLPLSVTVEAVPGVDQSLPAARLEYMPARLEITGAGNGALVAVDGKFAGTAPLSMEIEAGKSHAVVVTQKGHETVRKTVNAGPGEEIRLQISPAARTGRVFVSTAPQGAAIFVDGKKMRVSPADFTLPATEHEIEVQKQGYAPAKRTVLPEPGNPLSVFFNLEKVTSAGIRIDRTVQQRGLVLFGTGKFIMGSSRREQGRRSNEVIRNVEITRRFYIGAREVTNGMYRLFDPGHDSGSFAGFSLNADAQPVVNVTWQQAASYCNWLSRQDGLAPFYREEGKTLVPVTPHTNGYRLPTEAEWVWAVRYGGRETRPLKYAWGTGYPPSADRAGNYADESARSFLPVIIEGYNDGFVTTAPAGSFKAQSAGLFDAGGNVSEWCHDYYSPVPPVAGRILRDPFGPSSGTHHVVRGASWRDSSITVLRLSYRGYSSRATDHTGFRIARFADADDSK